MALSKKAGKKRVGELLLIFDQQGIIQTNTTVTLHLCLE